MSLYAKDEAWKDVVNYNGQRLKEQKRKWRERLTRNVDSLCMDVGIHEQSAILIVEGDF
jgi:hypothetical protein